LWQQYFIFKEKMANLPVNHDADCRISCVHIEIGSPKWPLLGCLA
jgi:hypothetical protein